MDISLGFRNINDLFNESFHVVFGDVYLFNILTTQIQNKDNILCGFIHLFDVWVIQILIC